MKKTYKYLLVAVMLLLLVTVFVACKDNEGEEVATSLPAPQNITASGSTVSWSAVEGASSYDVIVDSQEPVSTENVFYQVDITTTGDHIVQVRAVGTNSKGTTIYSEYASFTFNKSQKLDAPVVSVNQSTKTASWSAVLNASSYLVKVISSSGEQLYNEYQPETSFSFDDTKYSSTGKYTIQVKAIPDSSKTEYANSDTTVAYYIVSTTLATPSITSVNQTSVTWTSISGSISYDIYVYKVGGSAPDWPKVFHSSSNSYAFSNMGFEDLGTYYCLVQAIGDGEVYKTSAISERNVNYDLTVVNTFDYDSVSLTYNSVSQKWELEFTSYNVDLLNDFVITLQTTKADGSSSLPSVSKTINITDADIVYEVTTAEYDATKVYYVEKAAGYVKNTEKYDSSVTYYTFDGATDGTGYHEATSITGLDERVEYFIKHDAAYKVKAQGKLEYIQVTENEAFNSRFTYYTRTGAGTELDPYVYTECKAEYDAIGVIDDLDDEDLTTVYLTYDTSVYTVAGTYANLDPDDHSTVYYVYKPFNPTTLTTDYYRGVYAAFDKATYDLGADTYYIVKPATFMYEVDDLFFTRSGSEYTYTKSDIAYYGKIYNITIDANGVKNNIITGEDAVCPTNYISYRAPILIDKDTPYDESKIKGYFKDEAAYTKFVTKYDDYYAVESIGDLQYIPYAPSANYVLMKDLDGGSYYWQPIKEFTGILDGNNHKIENIVYESTVIKESTPYFYRQGLFAKISSATIKDLYLINVSNKAEARAITGGIVGVINDDSGEASTIQNCYVKGTITSVAEAGGIVGRITNNITTKTALVLNCQADITITNSALSGGIVGVASGIGADTLTIKNCIANGSITSEKTYVSVGDFDALKAKKYESYIYVYAKENDEYIELARYADLDDIAKIDEFKNDSGEFYSEYFVRTMEKESTIAVGGLIGASIETDVANSYACVDINVDCNDVYAFAGGFIGYMENGTVTKSHAGKQYSKDATKIMDMVISAQQEASSIPFGVGGFIGSVQGATITDSYTTIRVSASDYFGGFIGNIKNDSTIERCYSTGGIAPHQTGDHKAAFIANDQSSGSTINRCYYDNYFKVDMDPGQAEQKSLPDILAFCNESQAGTYTTITGYLEACGMDIFYVSAYTDSVRPNADLHITAKIAEYDSVGGTTTVIDRDDTEKVNQIIIGDYSTKGTCLYIYQLKGGLDPYGDDDGTGARVVIYVTIE